jgi:hypothetical protein
MLDRGGGGECGSEGIGGGVAQWKEVGSVELGKVRSVGRGEEVGCGTVEGRW